ncbi:hypothetical protein ACWC09_26490 [Streptomyces sp. NPDC001617]
MSHGRHRAPKPAGPPRRGLRRLAATLTVAAAAAGIGLAADTLASATPSDTGWGAPDTTTVVTGDTGTGSTGTTVQPYDTGWG